MNFISIKKEQFDFLLSFCSLYFLSEMIKQAQEKLNNSDYLLVDERFAGSIS